MAINANTAVMRAPTEDEIRVANKTSRSKGAVGRNPLCRQVVYACGNPNQEILDFGAGKEAVHTKWLRDRGLRVTAHEFGANQYPGRHDPAALKKKYDVVMASNVLNVQSSEAMLRWTLGQIAHCLKPGGSCIANYPTSPRKLGLKAQEIEPILEEFFDVIIEYGRRSAPVYRLRHKHVD